MSYLAALDRAAGGLSAAQPRPLSRFEQPDIAWGEAEDLSDAASPGPDPQPRAAGPAQPGSVPPPGPAPTAAPARPAKVEAGTPPTTVAASPWPTPSLSPAPPPALIGGQLPAAIQPVVAPVTVAPPLAAPPRIVTHVTARAERQVVVPPPRSDPPAMVVAQPVPLPPGEPVAAPKPQIVTLLPPPDPTSASAPGPEPAPAPNAPYAPNAPDLIIEIGQIDIRIDAPVRAAPPIAPARRPSPVLSLDDYLRGRT